MAYLRCESCGAKALVAASRCPKCAHEFHLTDGRGDRVSLARCRGCGIMHRRDRSCHWCPQASTSRWRSPVAMQAVAAALGFMLVGAGTWTYGGRVGDLAANAWTRAAVAIRESAAQPAAAAPVATVAVAPALPAPATVGVALPPIAEAAVVDSVHWVPAVARTWVNVRNDASRSGSVVGVIKTGSRAMLGGTGRAGWRQVRSDSATGWVDPRHFEADSAGTRG